MANWGWIDFSREDRDLAREIIASLDEPGAVDELGIGMVRDAFADRFFPGTSTIQTRAKYFFLVAYQLKDLMRNPGKDPAGVLAKREAEVSLAIWKADKTAEGVFGRTIFPHQPSGWVKRPPSEIYWNGIKKLGLIQVGNPNLSLGEFLQLLQGAHSTSELSGEEWDDAGAAGNVSFCHWQLPEDWSHWDRPESLSIELTHSEASFLCQQIINRFPGTLFAQLVRNRERLPEDFEHIAEEELSGELKREWRLARDFSLFLKPAQCRFNCLLQNQDALARWPSLEPRLAELAAAVELEELFALLALPVGPRLSSLSCFLSNLKRVYIQNKPGALDELLRARERSLKGTRAKTLNPNPDYRNNWVGGGGLTYRFPDAKRLIDDIVAAEVRVHA